MSGNIFLSLTEFDDCNKTPKDDCTISSKCCDFHELNFDFDFDSNTVLKSAKTFNTPNTIEQPCIITSKTVLKSNNANFYANLPPPSGYELIKLVQVFRI